MPRSSRSLNVEIQKAEILGFSHVLEQYLNNYMQYYKEATSLWTKNKASVKASNSQMDRQINLMVKVIKSRNLKCRKLGFLHVLEQYLYRYVKVHKKTTSR